ncbi:MAG: LysE family translocator [Verrucomicrobiota bacterium]
MNIDLEQVLLFIPIFWPISLSPGMCMMLSLSLGISHGLRRTFWMMLGELTGVALVSVAAVAGVAAMMLAAPNLFRVFCLVGGGYLIWLGIGLWRDKGRMAVSMDENRPVTTRRELALQGFLTAVSNPKGWGFMITLLPPFMPETPPVAPQLITLLIVIVLIEFSSLTLYAAGGQQLRIWLLNQGRFRFMNRLSGTLMIGVGIWLAAGSVSEPKTVDQKVGCPSCNRVATVSATLPARS